ncbi:DnaB-like helicase C-terminal domain-containing protein [Kineosporia sp. R_H_3]|uniref:replicative DNA helicase n=1 Tax=Kineosporia sp. R_H_3 TaxID=1961848 RepID=UPI000B4BB048|nr:DnaB-like helicase C-terminal domain-containing protein [Kineosporia sp. R_H_3]
MTADLHVVDPYVDGGPDAPTAGTRHDAALEQFVLGSLITGGPAVRDAVLETGLAGADFYRPPHEEIWEAIDALAERRDRVDPMAVANELTARGSLARVGGHAYLHTLVSQVSSAWAAPKYATEITADATLRRLDAAAVKARQIASTSGRHDVDEALDLAAAEIAAVADGRHLGTGDDDLGEAIDLTIDELQNGRAPALPTGLVELDQRLNGGLRKKTITTIGARPAVGKTVVGLQIALNVALESGQPVGYTSLEMAREDLLLRAYAAIGAVDYSRLLKAPKEPLTEQEWRAVSKAAEKVRESGLIIPNRDYASVASIRSDIRRVQRRRGACALWVVDYLQLVTPAETRGIPREQQVAAIMRGLKKIALGLETPIILLAQLSRDGEKTGRPPVLTDLRESGSIEQDSDNVILLHRNLEVSLANGAGTTSADQPGPDELGLLIAKNRRGISGGFLMTFEGRYQRAIPKQWRPSDAAAR